MQDHHKEQTLEISNPIQAASEIFYKPKAVFDALSVRENWSWIPFILLCVILFIPPYLYFGLVDFDWWLDVAIMPTFADLPPSQQENMLTQYSPSKMQLTIGITSSVSLIVIYAIKAFYFSMITRNDNKGVQGFTDWFGAMWWIAMPMLVNALLSLILLTFQDSGTQIEGSILAPLSLAFLFSVDMASPWFSLLSDIRIDVIWSIGLAYICVRSWTNFNQVRALITAIFPAAFFWVMLIITALVTQS
ncbi:MAG: hypothetical protein ACJAVV_003699 [Alphaproteobacteria bacterium]|jgi:hypothetical protein